MDLNGDKGDKMDILIYRRELRKMGKSPRAEIPPPLVEDDPAAVGSIPAPMWRRCGGPGPPFPAGWLRTSVHGRGPAPVGMMEDPRIDCAESWIGMHVPSAFRPGGDDHVPQPLS